MESVPIPTHTYSRTSNGSDNGNSEYATVSKLHLLTGSVDVKDSSGSHSQFKLGVNSEEFHIIEQGFATLLSTSKSLKRVEEKSQSFPRFFTMTTEKIENEACDPKLPSATENLSSKKTSPHGSATKIPEDGVLLTSSSNHSTPEPNLLEDKSQTRIVEANEVAENSNPETKSSETSSIGFWGIFDEKSEKPTHIELTQATQGSTISLPAGSSHIKISSTKLAVAQRPHTASSIPSSSFVRVCHPSVRFGKSYPESRIQNPFDQLAYSGEHVNKTHPQSSHCSLQEIESFHQQFVGDLPLLSCPFVKQADNADLDVLDESPETGFGEELKNIEVVIEDTLSQPKPQQPTSSSDKLEVEETKTAVSTEVEKLEVIVSRLLSTENEEDRDDKEITLNPLAPEQVKCTQVNKTVGKNISTFVAKYVEFMEKEWKRRRDIWVASQEHNTNSSRKKSVYVYETFRECVAHGKIQLQVPFDLPEVNETNKNPVLKDNDETEKEAETATATKNGDLMGADCNKKIISSIKIDESSSISVAAVASSGVIEENELTKKDTSSVEELNVTPLDLTDFLEECRDLWEDLRNDGDKPSGNKQEEESITKDRKEGHQAPKDSNADPVKTSGDDVYSDPSPTKATDIKLDNVGSSSSSKKTSESFKPRATKSDKSNANATKTAAAKSKFNPVKSKLPSRNVVRSKSKKESSPGSKAPNKIFLGSSSPSPKIQKSTKMQVQFSNENESCAPAQDPITNEPLVEIYRGLSRENTMSNLKKNENENLEYKAFVNGRTVTCESLEQKTRLDICCMKLNTIQSYASNLKDLNTLPGVKILPYLSLFDCMNCRLVSKSWNNAVIASKAFLLKTTFIVGKKPLGALATLEASKVRWQHLRCSVIPAINFSNSSYNGRYHSANLRVTPVSARREPLTNTLTTIIFENFDIHKQQLVQWIQNCKKLLVIEVRNCNFMKTTTSMNLDKINKVMERIQVMKFADMDIMKLAEALRFFLPAARRLHTLEIIQKRDAKPKSVTLTTRKTAEDEIATIICPALLRNSKTLKHILFELVSAKTFLLQSRIIDTLGSETFQLNSFVVRSYYHLDSRPCFKIDSYGSSKSMTGQLRSTLNSSQEMTLLDFPMLEIDFIHGEDGSWLLPTKLKKLAAQLEMPRQEAFNTDVEFPDLKELELYGTPLEDVQWYHVKQTMKGLTQLKVHCMGIRDTHLQAIIYNLKSLQVLCLENTQDVTDFGITGMDKSWIERLKMYWPEKTDTSYEQFSKDKIRFVGKSLASLEDLHTFKMKGDFSISNVGILYGFNSMELTTLELKGSAVNASNSGLFILGFQCSQLQNVAMVVQHTKANQSGIRDLYEALLNRDPDTFSVELLPSEILGAEDNLGSRMITAE